MRKALTCTVAAIACITLIACGGNKGIKIGKEHKIGDDAAYSLHAADQTSGGKTIKVPEAYFKDAGYIAIHADAGGTPGPVIGVSDLLKAGERSDVKIKLTKPLTDTAKVWPMIHLEDNNNTTYDFPNGDAPAKTADGKVVTLAITVTVR